MKTLALSFFLLCPAAFGQLFSYGVRGGVPLTDPYSSSDSIQVSSGSMGYLVGPMVEVRLPFGLGVEADALYRPQERLLQLSPNAFTSYASNSSSWEFPILAKYHFLPLPLVKPYIDAGPSFRTYLSTAGLTLGAGVDIKLLRLHLEPEFRYIRWGSARAPSGAASIPSGTSVVGAIPVSLPVVNQNQVEFLIGLAF